LALTEGDDVLPAFCGKEVEFLAIWGDEVLDSVPGDSETTEILLQESGYSGGHGSLWLYPEGDKQVAATA
jgi:hypothetical protein